MAESQQEAQHFLDYWRVVQSRKEIVIAVSLFVILAGVVLTLSLPKVYMASTRIGVRQDLPDVPFQYSKQQPMVLGAGYDPYFLRTQFEVIQSKPILYEAIRNLRLQEHFGRLYSEDGSPMSLQDAYKNVVHGMKVQQYRDTNLIEIRIYRSTRRSTPEIARQDASRVANEIASVYRDYRMKMSRDEQERGVDALQQAYAIEQKKVEELEGKLETLRQDLHVNVVGAPSPERRQPWTMPSWNAWNSTGSPPARRCSTGRRGWTRSTSSKATNCCTPPRCWSAIRR